MKSIVRILRQLDGGRRRHFQKSTLRMFDQYRQFSELDNIQTTTMADDDVVAVTACKSGDMKDGEMKEISFGEHGTALLLKCGNEYFATSNKCTHYNAPLVKGSLSSGGRLRCPWHGACFNVRSGDIEDYPGLDSLHTFEVVENEGHIIVNASKSLLKNGRRRRKMSNFTDHEGSGVVIIGGGASAATCAETLRQNGYSKKILMLTKDSHPPYDRTKLSKDMNIAPSSIYLRNSKFYDQYGILMRCETEATKVDTSNKTVQLSDGNKVFYDKLLIATGSVPRTLPIPGWELKNVFVLRNPKDAAQIYKQASGRNVVVIGASFIGMEVASALVDAAASVTICEYFAVPYQTVLGPDVGKVFQSLHEERGIKFHMNASVTEMRGRDGFVQEVILKNGLSVQADVVIAGIGVVPATKFLESSDIKLDQRGFVLVDKYMETSVKDVYAGGDITVFPLKMLGWRSVNVQHWQMAHYHGSVVGKNIISDRSTEASSVPFFWSSLGPGKNLRYAGNGIGHDDVVITGSLSEKKFCAYYCKGDEVLAIATFMMDPKAAQLAEEWRCGNGLRKTDIL